MAKNNIPTAILQQCHLVDGTIPTENKSRESIHRVIMDSRLFINAQLFITLDHIFDVVRDNRASFSIRTDSTESRRSRLAGMGCCQMHIHKYRAELFKYRHVLW